MVGRNVLRKVLADCQTLRNKVSVLGASMPQAPHLSKYQRQHPLNFQVLTSLVLVRHQRKCSLRNHLTKFQSNRTIKELVNSIAVEPLIRKPTQRINLLDLSRSKVISMLVPSHLPRPWGNSRFLIWLNSSRLPWQQLQGKSHKCLRCLQVVQIHNW